MIRKSLTFTANSDYKKLSVCLKKNEVSAAVIRELKLLDRLLINDIPAYAIEKVQKGDKITVLFLEEDRISCDPEDIPINIIYEDCDILIVDKKSGMTTHPARGTSFATLANAVTNYYISCGYKIPFRPVSRLDRETSGIIVIVKNKYSHLVLSNQMSAGIYKKNYIARVSGQVKEDGEITLPIARENEDTIKRICKDDGKFAHTIYKVLEQNENSSLLNVEIKTGRTHQIRVHLEAIGHPIIGDPIYGSTPYSRMLLHASRVEILHPITKEKMEFQSKPDF